MELEQIRQRIHEIRGRKVMLDSDLAKLYEVETRVLKQAVRRNIKILFEPNNILIPSLMFG